jgi:hypothetical protein
VKATEPLALHHSWPLFEQSRRFDLGLVLNCAAIDLIEPAEVGDLGIHHAACWECDLADNSLTWSGGVYDIFGLPRGSPVTREETVALYSADSRATLERLRSYAIRHRRGFTLDAQIMPVTGGIRWMRIIGAPVQENDRAVRLHGLKLVI